MNNKLFPIITASILFFAACTNPSVSENSIDATNISSSSNSQNDENKSSNNEPVDLCRCLTEPGDSDYMRQHGTACDAAISSAIGVTDWKKVNMSQNTIVSNRFDALARKCAGSNDNGEVESASVSDNIDGVYRGSDNISGLALEAKLVISGDRWSAVSKLGYDAPEIQNGVVHGTDLYDDSGMLKIGYVSGNTARIDGYPSMHK
jgi:hypothetical protein